jgi:hypothetical protein
MKTKLSIIVFCLMMCVLVCVGCVSVKYNPKTGEIGYARAGDQEVNGFYFSTDPNGIHVELESQKSNMDAMLNALNKAYLAGLAARALTPVP